MSRPDMKNYLFALILMCCPQSSSAADSGEEIRAIRAEMNVGFNTQPRNFDFISTRLTENFTLIGPAGRFASPETLAKFYSNLTKRRPDVTWTRTSESIEVNDEWNNASERGTWREVWMEPDGETILTGNYQALWKREKGKWLLDAEIFIPLKCAGSSYCQPKRKTMRGSQPQSRGTATSCACGCMLFAPALIVIEKTATGYSAYSPDLGGCVATGAINQEVEQNMREAIELHLEGLRHEGYGCSPTQTPISTYVDVAVSPAA